MIYKISEFRTNTYLEKSHPSFYTFDVLTELIAEGEEKWLSIPYEMYFEWVLINNEKLTEYIKKREFHHHLELIKDLEEIGFNFEKSVAEYIHKYYPPQIFIMLPYYFPDELNINDENSLDNFI